MKKTSIDYREFQRGGLILVVLRRGQVREFREWARGVFAASCAQAEARDYEDIIYLTMW